METKQNSKKYFLAIILNDFYNINSWTIQDSNPLNSMDDTFTICPEYLIYDEYIDEILNREE